MKTEEKIRKYMDDELTPDELKNFEKEISRDTSLQKKIYDYRNTLDQFKLLKNVNTEDKYFINLLPDLREKLNKQKKMAYRPSFALGSFIIIMLTATLFLIFNTKEPVQNQITINDINTDELNNYLSDYSEVISTSEIINDIPQSYDSVFSSVVGSELELFDFTNDYIVEVSNNEFYNILDDLSDEEIQNIYNNLIKEDFN